MGLVSYLFYAASGMQMEYSFILHSMLLGNLFIFHSAPMGVCAVFFFCRVMM